MISAIVLAAGAGRRMGKQKLLLPIGDLKLIEHVVHEVCAGGVDDCLVVTGSDAEKVAALKHPSNARLIYNEQHLDGGMLSSVRCGLHAADPKTTGFLVCLGDQPDLSSQIIQDMLREVRDGQPEILVPMFQQKRGHPLYFKAHYAERVLSGYDDVGLKGLLREYADRVVEWPCASSSVLLDLDTPSDYQKWLARQKNRSDDPASDGSYRSIHRI